MEPVPQAVEAVPDGQRLSDWHEQKRIPRTNAYGLLRLLAIVPEQRKVPGARKLVSWLSAEQIATLDPLADRLRDGATTLAKLQKELSGTVRHRPEGMEAGALASVPHNAEQSGIVPHSSASFGMEALAQLAAALAPAPVPLDPLTVPRRLAEAADLGAWLSTPELAAVVGMAPGTVRGWADGHTPRPGFVVARRREGSRTWWRVADAPAD